MPHEPTRHDCPSIRPIGTGGRAVVVIPVQGDDPSGLLEQTVDHLAEIGVTAWAEVLPVGDPAGSRTDLLYRGMARALQRGAAHICWLGNGCLPRVGALERLLDISRSRHAIAAAGRIFPVGVSGHRKTVTGSRKVILGRGEISPADWISGTCAVLPASLIRDEVLAGHHGTPDRWTICDFCLRARDSGVDCLAVGDAAVDLHPLLVHRGAERRPSWLLGDEPITRVWRRTAVPGNALNPLTRLRFFVSHWGVPGLVPGCSVYLRLAAITLLRCLFPLWLLRKWFGSRSEAWILERAYGTTPAP